MIDRSLAPALKPIEATPLPPYEVRTLPTGHRLYMLPYGAVPVVEIQWVLNAGNCNEPAPGLATFAARLMTEGTTKHSSLELAQALDDYGAAFSAETGVDYSNITLSVMTRHLTPAFHVAAEIMREAAYPEEEFLLQQGRIRQNLTVEAQKTAWQSRRVFNDRLFGEGHPYAAHLNNAALDSLTRADLADYYRAHLRPDNCFVIVAGQFDPNTIVDLMLQLFEGLPARNESMGAAPPPMETASGLFTHQMNGQMQCSIRMGHLGFPRSHPDIYRLRLTNTILGGYFGSRLMSNIREEKGYTYGVHSGWVSYKSGGFFTVATDVGNDFVTDTRDQVRLEIERMQQEKVGEDELLIAKNYYLGRIISETETPFQIADRLKYQVIYDLAPDELERSFREIQAMTPEDILVTAQTYWRTSALLEVVAGQYQA